MGRSISSRYRTVEFDIIGMDLMKRVISLKIAQKISEELQEESKTIALTGGCFDILHIGHVTLFEKAKATADTVFVFVESDEKIKQIKGIQKPIHSQKDRTEMLSQLRNIDYVIPLPFFRTNDLYDKAVKVIHPNFLVTTKGDAQIIHKKRQAKKVNAKIVYANFKPNSSTTKLAEILRKEL